METENEELGKLFEERGVDWKFTFWEEPEKSYVELETHSPLGENVIIKIDFDPEDPVESFIDNLKDYYQNFDPEDHAAPFIEHRGKNGVPDSIRDLVDDAEAIDSMIKDLIFALEPKKEGADRRTISRDELAQILDARDTLCGYCGNDACGKCIVTMLVSNAYNECQDESEE